MTTFYLIDTGGPVDRVVCESCLRPADRPAAAPLTPAECLAEWRENGNAGGCEDCDRDYLDGAGE